MKLSKQGFSLIETIVAISIMLIGIVGLYALVPFYLKVVAVNKDRFVASQLAREGIEFVRNIRDSNLLAGNNWNDNLTGCVSGCQMDYNDDAGLSGYTGMSLRIDPSGFYKYEGGLITKYKRKITITSTDPNKELNVEVEIFGLMDSAVFKAVEIIYNWR